MCWRRLVRRLKIFESNYGRKSGWLVERDGRCVAVLTKPLRADQFWYSYEVEFLTEDPDELAWLRSVNPCAWTGRLLTFRSRQFGDVVEHAYGWPPREGDGRVIMRGLYLNMWGPWPWEWLFLWLRRKLRLVDPD